ncbi:N-acetyltransferase [Planctobacterium marinum]
MTEIEYTNLQELERGEFLAILNEDKIRKHLVTHEQFNDESLADWIASKISVDATRGCKVRGIRINGAVAGWCGIQFENDSYELAIVLNEAYWGIGIRVFKDLMIWASELGHRTVVLHLFNTRPEYKFLTKMASRVYESTMFGQKYTSYELKVPNSRQQ